MPQPLKHQAFAAQLDPAQLVSWYVAARERSKRLFSIPHPDSYYERPISLRNPIVFYEGHLPAFAVNTLIKLGLGGSGIDPAFETLFARGIDPEDEAAAKSPTDLWPSRRDVQAYGDAADALILRALQEGTVELDYAYAIIEHEFMHQETLMYMFNEMPLDKKLSLPAGTEAAPDPTAVRNEPVSIPAGVATIGGDPGTFGWDNEFPSLRAEVPAFAIDRLKVSNGEYLEFVEATGAAAPHFWLRREGEWFRRGMFETVPLPLSAPVYVTRDEAAAYAKWKGKRLPSEAEYHRAAFGTPSGEERQYPWGDEPPDPTRGNFDFTAWDPAPAGSFPAGASAWGIHDLAGNGWEWTSTLFAPLPGFEPMRSYPQYSADFFDNAHYVLKGASPVTARELVRRSFRNWFRPNYPYVFATFRCVTD